MKVNCFAESNMLKRLNKLGKKLILTDVNIEENAKADLINRAKTI